MMDDVDRQCCEAFEKVISQNPPDGWALKESHHHDPGFTMVFEYSQTHFANNPKVTVTIGYGNKPDRLGWKDAIL